MQTDGEQAHSWSRWDENGGSRDDSHPISTNLRVSHDLALEGGAHPPSGSQGPTLISPGWAGIVERAQHRACGTWDGLRMLCVCHSESGRI